MIAVPVPFIVDFVMDSSRYKAKAMLRTLGKGLLARLLAYAVIGLGFWLLFQGFLGPNILLGILGGAMIPSGMYLIVTARRGPNLPQNLTRDDNQKPGDEPVDQDEPVDNEKEEAPIDPIHDPIHDPIDRSR